MKNTVRFVLVLTLWALPAAAQNNWDWSMPGSSGVVGDGTASLGLYAFTGATFRIGAGNVADVDARYPVTNTVGSASDISPAWTTLQMTVHDQYTGGTVTSTLYEVDKCTGTETQVCSVTSSDTDQDAHCDSCTFSSSTFDFANNAYYVHVSISNLAGSAADIPQLHALAIY